MNSTEWMEVREAFAPPFDVDGSKKTTKYSYSKTELASFTAFLDEPVKTNIIHLSVKSVPFRSHNSEVLIASW